jgi:curved DNA-binding protein CbpA
VTLEEDLYRILEVEPHADLRALRAAYRRLARRYHPDISDDAAAAHRMSEINRAWAVLRDPVQRAAYDRSRSAPAPGYATPRPTPHAGPTPPADGADGERFGRVRSTPSAWSARRPAGGSGGTNAPRSTAGAHWPTDRSTSGDPAPGAAATTVHAAGPPPGRPEGAVLTFSRYAGWSLGEIARHDPEFLEWLERTPSGRGYRDEIDALLRRLGRRSAAPDPLARPNRFRP